ncbi:PLC-like phosphodiesterase [Agrocybe pediades]|nr:PLC-like phosphodiesterase [Agrocybe pediades]
MDQRSNALQESALEEIIRRGEPILGTTADDHESGKYSRWMANFPDKTQLVHMNLPGTHDTCTWNYTPEVQESLERYTGPIPDSRIYRCQRRSIFAMLNDGIRVLDLRYAWNPDLETIGFYHSKALLSPTTRMEDVFFGLYHWLDDHPTETILVSLNYEPGTGTSDDAKLQEKLYHILTSKLAKKYWSQTRGKLGILGENRGRLILLQRFNFNLLPAHLSERIGIHLDPEHWTVNGKATELTYNAVEGHVAYIQDYYRIDPSPDSNPASCIKDKLQVIKIHLERAIHPSLHPDQLFISFASASFRIEEPDLTPEVYAAGNDDDLKGINIQLLPWLKNHGGKRFGIILLDFYEAVPELVGAIISQQVRSKF